MLLKCGDIFFNTLYFPFSGNFTHPIIISSYYIDENSNLNQKPIIKGNNNKNQGIQIHGSFVNVFNIEVLNWETGISILNSINNCNISWNFISNNVFGISVHGFNHFIGYNILMNNNLMMPNTFGLDDDYGAQAILIMSNYSEYAYNFIKGSISKSEDYHFDGAAFELYGASFNNIHHNFAIYNCVFTELGKPSNINLSISNNFFRNIVINSYENQFLVQHISSSYGPVFNTTFSENLLFHFNEPTNYYGPFLNLIVQNLSYNYDLLHANNNLLFSSFHPIGFYENTEPYLNLFNFSNGFITKNKCFIWLLNNWSNFSNNRTPLINHSLNNLLSNSMYYLNSISNLDFKRLISVESLWNDTFFTKILNENIQFFL